MARVRQELVWAYVREVPTGHVVTYGQVAKKAGTIAKAVGAAMAALPDNSNVPWWRVVMADGSISPNAPAEDQRRRLKDEGVSFNTRKCVNLNEHRHRWRS